MGFGVLRGLEAGGPDVVVREAGENGDGDELGVAVHRLRCGLHHVEAAGGVQVDDAGRGRNAHQRLHGGGNRVGNVVELEIEEDRKPGLRHAGVALKAVRVEELHADLGPADMRFQRLRKRHGLVEVRRVNGNTDRVGGHGRRLRLFSGPFDTA